MKKAYSIFLIAAGIIILSWFLPWLYSIIFPASVNDPFIAWSPVNDSFIVSEPAEKGGAIYAVDELGEASRKYSKEDRDSLLPQIYFNQLVAHDKLPDSIDGKEITIPALKHSQWVFSSLPRDLNKVGAKVYLMMESMPARFELEDPEVVFRIKDNSRIEFIDIATNTVNANKTKRFNEIFTRNGFKYPIKSASADITTRKPYDEGYLMADDNGEIYHVKMQAGRPFMVKINKPDSIIARHLFIMEESDARQLGIVSDENHNMYVIEKDGYKLIQLPVGKIDPEKSKLSIVKNMFNWVVKINDDNATRWIALDSDDYSLLGQYSLPYPTLAVETAASYIFPFELTFTSVSDCVAKPRLSGFSINAIYLIIILAVIMLLLLKGRSSKILIPSAAATLIFGIFAFIPLILTKE